MPPTGDTPATPPTNLYEKVLQRSCSRDGYSERGTEPLSSKRVSPATAETTARAALSSESQLIRCFENKSGLQIAPLDRGWTAVLGSVTVNTSTAGSLLQDISNNSQPALCCAIVTTLRQRSPPAVRNKKRSVCANAELASSGGYDAQGIVG